MEQEKPMTKSMLREMREEVLGKMVDLSTAAFGVIAALAWNDAIKAWMQSIVEPGDGPGALIQYAAIVTVGGVIVTMLIARAAAKMGVQKK